MSFFAPENLRTVCGGRWLARPQRPPAPAVSGVSVDSRSIEAGQVFVAIKGERFDGHAYLLAAARAGSPVLIVQDEGAFRAVMADLAPAAHVLLVSDTRKTLARMAAAYRRTLERTKVIAVCGSNGKTTTTRLIAAALATKLRGTAPKKSFNNDIGVPLTILSAKTNDQYLICEVGSNAPGEIATLGAIVEPDIAVITSIGREHLQGFGDLGGVAREEAAILAFLRPGGAAVVVADAPEIRPLTQPIANVVLFGRAGDAALRLTSFEHVRMDEVFGSGSVLAGAIPDGIRLSVNGRASFVVPLVGEHNALNAMAAVAVARRVGLADEDIAAGLASATPPEMRFQRSTLGRVTIVNDAYNANPESTLAALRTFAALYAGADRRVVVLGDMLELGDATESAHREIGQAVLELGCIDLLATVGERAALAGELARTAWGESPARVLSVPAADETGAADIAAILRPGDAVLLKGSRGMALEGIIRALRARLANEGSPAPAPASRR
ncbi:MAG: UDP-N-acetylmuramoyl-tripeptide--D-alanyl-D-alanine ligase [Phycisphaerales bacterium]